MTQNQRILKYMEDFGSISTLEAFKELGVTRLASRIHEISKVYHFSGKIQYEKPASCEPNQ